MWQGAGSVRGRRVRDADDAVPGGRAEGGPGRQPGRAVQVVHGPGDAQPARRLHHEPEPGRPEVARRHLARPLQPLRPRLVRRLVAARLLRGRQGVHAQDRPGAQRLRSVAAECESPRGGRRQLCAHSREFVPGECQAAEEG